MNLKNEELELTNQYYILLFTIDHNLESGVLRYTQTFTAVSITLLLCLISAYISTTALGIAPLSMFIGALFLYIIISGLYPLLAIALYKPSLKLVKYWIVSGEITAIEYED